MLEKLFRPLVNIINLLSCDVVRHREAVDRLTQEVVKLELTIDVGFATVVRTQLALMNGTERARFDTHADEIKVKLPSVERKPL